MNKNELKSDKEREPDLLKVVFTEKDFVDVLCSSPLNGLLKKIVERANEIIKKRLKSK